MVGWMRGEACMCAVQLRLTCSTFPNVCLRYMKPAGVTLRYSFSILFFG